MKLQALAALTAVTAGSEVADVCTGHIAAAVQTLLNKEEHEANQAMSAPGRSQALIPKRAARRVVQ